jgi:hypothetical protein
LDIQGERVDYLNVEQLTQRIFGNTQHAKRIQSISGAALGVLSSSSLIIHRIGQGLARENNLIPKHAIKQVDRLLSNRKLKLWDCFEQWVPFIIGARKTVIIAMDWTEFEPDNQSTIALNLVTSHGRATPLIWKTVDRSTLKNHRNAYEDECLLKLYALLEQNIAVTILADRGFCDTQLFKYLKGYLHFNFVIRIRKNIEVTNSKGEQRKAIDWLGKGGRSRSLKNASLTKKQHKVGVVVCVQAKKMKAAWCLAASDETLSSSLIIRLYGKRWGIEPQFRDSKDIHFGMGLSYTKIRNPQRRDRLLLISALAVVILTLLGAAGESLGLDKGLKANTVKHRTLSLFRQGYYYYHQLERMKKEQAARLLDAFQKMLEEHVQLVYILGVI